MSLPQLAPIRSRFFAFWIFFFTWALCVACAGSSRAATLIVTNTAGSGAGSLYQAILTANSDNDGDIITFDPAVFAARQTIFITPALVTNASMTIQGPAAGVILDGSQNTSGYPVIIVDSDTSVTFLSNLILQNDAAGGLTNRFGALTMTNCTVQGNTSENGAGVFNDGTLTLNHCTLASNTCPQAGGGLFTYGPAVLTGCTLAGNTAGSTGGGIYNGNGGVVLTLTDCVVTGNVASSNGGGGISSVEGILTATNCTFTGNTATAYNSAYGGGGALALVRGTTTLINDIFRGDSSPQGSGEIFFDNNGTPGTLTASNCDIQGGFPGLASDDVDPLFVNAPTDLHLQPGSPCLGAGTPTGAPATDKDNVTRPNPPSIGAYELISPTHILWDNTNGTASLWNYSTLTGAFTQNAYGPYPGWTAETAADGGTDGLTRMLWDNTNGTASIWSLNNAAGAFTQFSFGPYSGWTAQTLSVGTDNTTHVLWTNANGQASLWNYSTANGTFTQNAYGPYTNWTARALADGPDGLTRLLWDKTDGTASIWSLNNGSGQFTQFSFGPYPGWTAKSVSVGTDNTTHILWTNTSGTASVWNYSTASGTFTQSAYGPYPGWTAAGVADGSDGKTRLLWKNANGTLSLWSLNNVTGVFSQFSFGPYPGWSAVTSSGT